MGKNMYILEDCKEQLTTQDITGLWVVIKPAAMRDIYFEEGRTRENQVVKAVGGFGCKPGALSVNGGKVFVHTHLKIDDVVYRNEIMGIASDDILKELKINAETV